jgi:hypothetical protein
VIGLDILYAGGVVHLRHDGFEVTQLLAGGAFGHSLADQFVERLAHVVDFVGFNDGDFAHEHAAILLRAHQPGFLERAQRLAYRAAAGTKSRRQLALVDVLADSQFAAQDELLDLDLHQGGQRVRLHQLQHRGGGSACHGQLR